MCMYNHIYRERERESERLKRLHRAFYMVVMVLPVIFTIGVPGLRGLRALTLRPNSCKSKLFYDVLCTSAGDTYPMQNSYYLADLALRAHVLTSVYT